MSTQFFTIFATNMFVMSYRLLSTGYPQKKQEREALGVDIYSEATKEIIFISDPPHLHMKMSGVKKSPFPITVCRGSGGDN